MHKMPNRAKHSIIDSIRMKRLCVKSALSKSKSKAANNDVHCVRCNSIIRWYVIGTIKLPKKAGTKRRANSGTLSSYSLPILSNLNLPSKSAR